MNVLPKSFEDIPTTELELIRLLYKINETGRTVSWSKQHNIHNYKPNAPGESFEYQLVVTYPWRSCVELSMLGNDLDVLMKELRDSYGFLV